MIGMTSQMVNYLNKEIFVLIEELREKLGWPFRFRYKAFIYTIKTSKSKKINMAIIYLRLV